MERPFSKQRMLFRVLLDSVATWSFLDAKQMRHLFERFAPGFNEAVPHEEERYDVDSGQDEIQTPRNSSGDRRSHLGHEEVGDPKRCSA